eukprot:tig00020697_g13089.t1
MLNLIARGVAANRQARAPNPHLRMDASGRSRVETHIVVGNINDKVLAPDKTWFQKVLDAAPTKTFTTPSGVVEQRPQRESNFMITIQTNYKPRSRGEGSKVQDAFHRGLEALFYDDRQLAKCIKMGVYADKANPKGLDFKSDMYDTHVERGNANIGIEYGPRSGRLHAHILLTLVHYSRVQFDGKRASDFLIDFMRTEGQGGLPNFYKDDWFGEEYQKTAVRPIRRKDALGMQWTGKETGYRKRETARQMHVDVKLLPQSNLKDLLQLYITKTVEALETGAVKLV